jgi:hypothetical protein
LLEEEMTRYSCKYKAMQLLLGENKSSDHLALTGMSYLRPHLQPALWTEGTKYCSQASHLVRNFRVPACNVQPIRQRKVGRKKRKKIPSNISTYSSQNPRYQEPIS